MRFKTYTVSAHYFMKGFTHFLPRDMVVILPVGYQLNDYALVMKRTDWMWPVAWAYYRCLRPLYWKTEYKILVWLYLRGWAWWPEGSRVSWRDIGRRQAWRDEGERLLWEARRHKGRKREQFLAAESRWRDERHACL